MIGRDVVPPSEFLPTIQPGQDPDGGLVFESPDDAERFLSLIMRHWNTIARGFKRGETRIPVILEGPDGTASGNDWAQGFLKGTRLRYEDWSEILEDDEDAGAFVPFFALVHEQDPDRVLRPFDKPVTPEQRQDLIVGVIAGVRSLYQISVEERGAVFPMRDNASRPASKIGRNEPCPCGSGRKYKKCCGVMTIH